MENWSPAHANAGYMAVQQEFGRARQLQIDCVHRKSALKSGPLPRISFRLLEPFRLSPRLLELTQACDRHENPAQVLSLGSESSVISASPRLRNIADRKPKSAKIEPASAIASRLWQGDGNQYSCGHQLRPYLPGKFQ